MKKILLTIFCIISFTAFSQDIKVKAGVNVPSFNAEYKALEKNKDVTDKNNVGFYVGAGYEYKMNNKFSLGAELLYNRLQYESKLVNGYKETFNMLSLPISFNYYPIEKLSVGAGVNFNYLLKSEIKNSRNYTLPDQEDWYQEKEETTERYNKINYGIHFSASYNIWKGLNIDARYYIGLGKINKEDDFFETKFNNLQLGLSYKF